MARRLSHRGRKGNLLEAAAKRNAVTRFSVRELGPQTWTDFARIVEKHNGVWGGCWCVSFHRRPGEDWEGRKAAQNRALKKRLVLAVGTHAALVYDG